MTRAAPHVLHICCTLLGGANAGELGPQPKGLEHTLEEAWPGAIGRIFQDASQALEQANRAINRLEDKLATMKKDGDNLFIRYEKECDRRHKAEEDVAYYRARLLHAVPELTGPGVRVSRVRSLDGRGFSERVAAPTCLSCPGFSRG